jgi:RNA polymerase sigma factor (sigma-70 family)
MENAQPGTILRQIRRLVVSEKMRDQSDAELLEHFAKSRDEDAFRALVHRHGRLVWNVCRNVLGEHHDAEDAFQATFLVLARNAGAIRKKEALAGWLHGTAHRTALRAKRDAAIRRRCERRRSMPAHTSLAEPLLRESLAVLDEEVARLPAKQRAVFVLCALGGNSQSEAGRQLGWKEGTVSGTLARARQRLRARLAARGVTLSAVLAALALGKQSLAAAPPALVKATISAAVGFCAGNLPMTAAVPSAVVLAQKVGRTMILGKLAKTLTLSIVLTLMAAGAGALGTGPILETGDVQASVPAAAPEKSGSFEDMTAASGIAFTFQNGEEADEYTILETIGGGVALIDFDNDGLLDIFLVGGGSFTGPDRKTIQGRPCRLYKNLGNFKFKDVTRQVGLAKPLFYSHGAAVCDYDGDGWLDLLVTGYGRISLYRNVAGPGQSRRFVDVTREAGLACGDHFWGTSAAWADFDGDGRPDLYICQYVDWSWKNHPQCNGPTGQRDVCPPQKFRARAHKLYRNEGNGRFSEVITGGIRVNRQDGDYGKGVGVVVVDVNDDGLPDIYVANDTTGNFLYLNRGQMRFGDIGLEAGVARNHLGVCQGSKGVDAGDPYGTGKPALWITNYENEMHALYRNDCAPNRVVFHFGSPGAGIAAIGQECVGAGTGFLDLDNDGWEDLFIANGHVLRHPQNSPRRQRPVMLRNRGRGRFESISERCGGYFQHGHCGRGVAIGDLDNDGFPDLVISHIGEAVVILKNALGPGHRWLGISLSGKDRRDVVGAKVVVEVDGRIMTRFAKGGGSYLSASDRRLVFGLGKATKSGRLTVYWPGGEPRIEAWKDLAVDRYHTLVQGKGHRP